MREHMKLREEHRHIKFLLSDESLQLLPEYEQRIQVSHYNSYNVPPLIGQVDFLD